MLQVIRAIIGGARSNRAVDVFKAEYELQAYRRQAAQIPDTIDFLVTPTAGTVYSIEQVRNDPIALNSNLGCYTNFLNLLDCAAIGVPSGFSGNGLSVLRASRASG